MLCCPQLSAQRDDDAAASVAQGHHQHVQKRPAAPHIGGGEVKHIGDAVLKAAQDEHRDPQEDADVLADFMGIVFEPVHGNEHQNVAQHGQDEDGQQTVVQLGLAHGRRLLRDARDAGQADAIAHQSGAHQISQPYRRYKGRVAGRLLKDVSHLPGEQVKPKGADGKQAQAEEHRPGHLVLAGQKHHTADADAHAAQHGI